jgi:ribokinase
MSGRVVVVGSVNMDLVVRSARLPGAGETVAGGIFERHHGGKGGNQAVAAARLGRPTVLVAAVGDDEFGKEARGALEAAGVDVSSLATIPGEPTGVALILVDEAGENLIAVASGANAGLTPEAVTEALELLGSLTDDVVLVSREIPADTVRAALRTARVAGARTVLNPAPATGIDAAELGFVDIVTPNRGESTSIAAALDGAGPLVPAGRVGDEAQAGGGSPDESEILARRLLGAGLVREAVIVTLGSDGALLVPAGAEPATRFAAPLLDAVDATGAGDTFSGALAALLAGGLSLPSAVRRSVVAASLSTAMPGARDGMPTVDQLEAAMTKLGGSA